MNADWTVPSLLWICLGLLLASALTRSSRAAILGWGLFSLFWLGKIGHYLDIEDYVNVALFFIVSLLCLYMAWVVREKGLSCRPCYWASYAAAVCGLIYFPFALIPAFQTGLIAFTTSITASILHSLSIPVVLESWNMMSLNGRNVQIILACTAIESIALFAGLILSVEAPLKRKLLALAASTLSIYGLNIIRNGFVIMAYGWSWFGENSFDIAHNLIAKIGSAVALLAVSYLVFLLLPELLSIIDELATEIKPRRGDPS
jgi:archaeosortase A (PGF-CTERM-specific)